MGLSYPKRWSGPCKAVWVNSHGARPLGGVSRVADTGCFSPHSGQGWSVVLHTQLPALSLAGSVIFELVVCGLREPQFLHL